MSVSYRTKVIIDALNDVSLHSRGKHHASH